MKRRSWITACVAACLSPLLPKQKDCFSLMFNCVADRVGLVEPVLYGRTSRQLRSEMREVEVVTGIEWDNEKCELLMKTEKLMCLADQSVAFMRPQDVARDILKHFGLG